MLCMLSKPDTFKICLSSNDFRNTFKGGTQPADCNSYQTISHLQWRVLVPGFPLSPRGGVEDLPPLLPCDIDDHVQCLFTVEVEQRIPTRRVLDVIGKRKIGAGNLPGRAVRDFVLKMLIQNGGKVGREKAAFVDFFHRLNFLLCVK